MKTVRLVAFLFAALAFVKANVPAQEKGFGLGIIVGEPTGISFKSWLTPSTAIDGGLAWSFAKGSSAFHVHADYLLHSVDAIETKEPICLYYGIGGRIKAVKDGSAAFGVRGVIGLDYFVPKAPVDVFLEVAPIMDLTPSTELSFNAGLGARYFFR